MAKPLVDRLETNLTGKAEVIRLDLLSGVGREAARQYGIRAVPSLVVVDGQGDVVYGLPSSNQIIAAVEAILAEK
ncbi:MAG: hypothetical protein KDF65_14585 [Anaerolineae bacterium]|nr:hypothetical protein [Anaerolineae bacterium]